MHFVLLNLRGDADIQCNEMYSYVTWSVHIPSNRFRRSAVVVAAQSKLN